MAAASPPGDDVAVREFLQLAVSLHEAVSAIHADHDTGVDAHHCVSQTFPTYISTAAVSLQRLIPHLQSARSGVGGGTAGACRKIGQDLVLRIDRLQSQALTLHASATTAEQFRALWSPQDVEALGARLHEVADKSQDSQLVSIVSKLRPPKPESPGKHRNQVSPETIGGAISTSSNQLGTQDARPNSVKKSMRPLFATSADPSLARRPRHAPNSLLNDFILDSLAYKSMRDREEEVVKAHAKTFDWVFNAPQVNGQTLSSEHAQQAKPLASWLNSNDIGPIYWITGKPGSGKSTFMRYLFQHHSTMEGLHEWSCTKPVSKAGFFFWTSGSAEQRSQKGLLRSLLHQLLSENPEYIPGSFPVLWEKLQAMTTKERIRLSLDWTVLELLDAFQQFVGSAMAQMNLCLFVDGLDEFEGDHNVIINFFKDLSLGPHGKSIKMCLSSRPWTVFETAFQYAVPNLRLQDLTYEDMYHYSRDRLVADGNTRSLFAQNAAASRDLVASIVQRADGVFLWVRLAVNELLKLSRPGFTVENMHGLLHTLPGDLYELFTKLLFQDQQEQDVSEASMLFQLIRAREIAADFVKDDSANALTIWEFAFAMDQDDDKLALASPVQEASSKEIHSRCKKTVEQITQRFAGLLDLHARQRQGNMRSPRFAGQSDGQPDGGSDTHKRVAYIHRTVRDWLMEAEGVCARLVSKSPPNFDPHLRLLRSYVLRLKRPLEEVEHHRRLDEWWPEIALAMTHARNIAVDTASLQRSFLNELNEALSWHWLAKPQDPYDHWARNAFGSYEARMKAAPIWQPFSCLAAKFGLVQYLREELAARVTAAGAGISGEQRELERDDATPLLSYATEFLCSRQTTIFPLSSTALVEFLLRNPSRINPGANHEYVDFNTRATRTPWIAVLRHLRDAKRRGWINLYDVDPEGTSRWSEIVRLFVEVGRADVDAVIVEDSWDPEVSASGVMELLDETYCSADVRTLKDIVGGVQGK